MADAQDLNTTWRRLEAALDEVAGRLTKDARPPAGVLEAFAATVAEARGALAAAAAETAVSAGDRLTTTRQAIQVRRKLQVVARLVAGSAWYAALARELRGASEAGGGATYGREGAKPASPSAPSIERRA